MICLIKYTSMFSKPLDEFDFDTLINAIISYGLQNCVVLYKFSWVKFTFNYLFINYILTNLFIILL